MNSEFYEEISCFDGIKKFKRKIFFFTSNITKYVSNTITMKEKISFNNSTLASKVRVASLTTAAAPPGYTSWCCCLQRKKKDYLPSYLQAAAATMLAAQETLGGSPRNLLLLVFLRRQARRTAARRTTKEPKYQGCQMADFSANFRKFGRI